eukprot:g9221.t1
MSQDLFLFRGSSDPLVEVVAYSQAGFCFRQRSSTKIRSLNPVWSEIFEIPVARSDDALRQAMAKAEIVLPENLTQLFPPEKPPAEMLLEKKGSMVTQSSYMVLPPSELTQTKPNEAFGLWEPWLFALPPYFS